MFISKRVIDFFKGLINKSYILNNQPSCFNNTKVIIRGARLSSKLSNRIVSFQKSIEQLELSIFQILVDISIIINEIKCVKKVTLIYL